jgi:hypothetical protein
LYLCAGRNMRFGVKLMISTVLLNVDNQLADVDEDLYLIYADGDANSRCLSIDEGTLSCKQRAPAVVAIFVETGTKKPKSEMPGRDNKAQILFSLALIVLSASYVSTHTNEVGMTP